MRLKNIFDKGRKLKLLILLAGLLLIATVSLLKCSSNKPAPLPSEPADTTAPATAIPDTSVTVPEVIQEEAETPAEPARSDSVQRDTRPPETAGYEDGFNAGAADAQLGLYKNTYDESSQFPHRRERDAYARAYRRGYEEGYAHQQHPEGHPSDETSTTEIDNDRNSNSIHTELQ